MKQVPHGPSDAVAFQAWPSVVPCADELRVARRRGLPRLLPQAEHGRPSRLLEGDRGRGLPAVGVRPAQVGDDAVDRHGKRGHPRDVAVAAGGDRDQLELLPVVERDDEVGHVRGGLADNRHRGAVVAQQGERGGLAGAEAAAEQGRDVVAGTRQVGAHDDRDGVAGVGGYRVLRARRDDGDLPLHVAHRPRRDLAGLAGQAAGCLGGSGRRASAHGHVAQAG